MRARTCQAVVSPTLKPAIRKRPILQNLLQPIRENDLQETDDLELNLYYLNSYANSLFYCPTGHRRRRELAVTAVQGIPHLPIGVTDRNLAAVVEQR